jgi:hypothetical protein
MEANKIIEIYKGHFQVILDFPTQNDLYKIISNNYKYIWGIEHKEIRSSWKNYDFTLFDSRVSSNFLMARNIEMEFIIETVDFLKIIPAINQTVKIVQTNTIPPNFLNLKELKGKSKYDLLKNKVDYLFELELPGAIDYAQLVSPNVAFLEDVISKFQA